MRLAFRTETEQPADNVVARQHPNIMPDKKPNLSVGRGEKLPVSKGAGLTAKGRKASFCARSSGWNGERGKAARKRWGC